MGPVSGLLWLAAAAVAVVCRFLPDAPDDHALLFWGLVGLTTLYAAGCITRAIPWQRVPLGGHALAVVALQPLVGAGLWLTGGADAYLGPMLVLPMLYVAYFFPARYVWPLAVLEIATYASPLLSSPGPHHLLLARTLAYAVAYAGVVATIQFLKRRLVAAERHQRRIARRPADRPGEPPRVRRGTRPRSRARARLHAAADRRRRVQADQRPLRPHDRRP